MSPGTTKTMWPTLALELAFIRGPCDVRLVQRHAQASEASRVDAELAGGDLRRDALVDDECQELGRRVAAAKVRLVVEVAEIQRSEHVAQCAAREPDVDDDAVGVELAAAKLDVYDVSRAVQVLRGTEHLALETVRDHEMVA